MVADSEVPAGALVAFLQKGLQYVEVETHLQEVCLVDGFSAASVAPPGWWDNSHELTACLDDALSICCRTALKGRATSRFIYLRRTFAG